MWPAAADSMWLDASGAPARIGAPVEGLYGFRVGYRYAVPGIPAGAFARTLVRMNGSTPVGAADHPTPTPSVGNASHIPEGTHCSLTGTTYMGVGDWLDVWAWQESGSSLTISGTGLKDDRVTTGVVFSVWLIAARQA